MGNDGGEGGGDLSTVVRNCSRPSSAEVDDEWIYTSTVPCTASCADVRVCGKVCKPTKTPLLIVNITGRRWVSRLRVV